MKICRMCCPLPLVYLSGKENEERGQVSLCDERGLRQSESV